jgi:hypothetical protein
MINGKSIRAPHEFGPARDTAIMDKSMYNIQKQGISVLTYRLCLCTYYLFLYKDKYKSHILGYIFWARKKYSTYIYINQTSLRPWNVRSPSFFLFIYLWCSPREYWMIYRGPSFLTIVSFRLLDHAPPLPPLSPQQAVYLSQSLSVSPVEFTDRKGGKGWARSKIIRPRERLALYNTLIHPLSPIRPSLSTGVPLSQARCERVDWLYHHIRYRLSPPPPPPNIQTH